MSRKTAVIFLIILSHFSGGVLAVVESCDEGGGGRCEDKKKAWPLKIIALCSILLASMIGVSAPLLTRSIPALSPERSLFTVVKAFASGIILGTGFMHVLPDSFEMMMSSCLKEHPWHEFPFTGLFAMFSAVITLMIDSLATSFYAKNHTDATVLPRSDVPLVEEGGGGSCGGHSHFQHLAIKVEEDQGSKLHRFRVIAMVLEMGIIVHSVVIGLSLGASSNTCSIKGLIAALCFHQMFEGMGLGGCILQAEYKMVKKVAMAFFFSVTTPLGIAVGMLLSESYKETSPQALVTVGLLNASSAGLLIYMALVDLLASDFMGSKLQGNIQLQLKCYVAVFIGAGGMAIMALWA